MRHLGNEVAVGAVGEIIFDRLVGMSPRHDFDLIGGRNDDLFAHVANAFVHHEHDGNAIFFGQIEGFDGEVEALLRRIGAKGNDLVIAMRPPLCLHHVGLGGERGQSGGGATALHVDENAGRFGHGGIADVLHHEGEAGARSDRKGLGSCPYHALQGNGGGEFIFHLDEDSANGRNPRGETFHHFGGGSDGVSGGASAASSQRAFAAGVVAVHEMYAGEDTARISLLMTSLHFVPSLAVAASTLAVSTFLGVSVLLAQIAKSGQYIPHKSQPLHFSGWTTWGGW